MMAISQSSPRVVLPTVISLMRLLSGGERRK